MLLVTYSCNEQGKDRICLKCCAITSFKSRICVKLDRESKKFSAVSYENKSSSYRHRDKEGHKTQARKDIEFNKRTIKDLKKKGPNICR